ncbi:MAG: hypothetical protein CBB72_012600 [Muricauda sp. TMED12]|nr:MAG: hypothetical protein CBB72_012600 [Muricauda sp. TMED12]
MALTPKALEVLKELKRISSVNFTTHILYGSDEALTLFRESPEALFMSDCLDFDVVVFEANLGKEPEILNDAFEIEGYCLIDQNTYDQLHDNLCKKVKNMVVGPRNQKWAKKQGN